MWIRLTRTGGTADANSPHIVTFASAFESVGSHSLTMQALSSAAAAKAEIHSITSNGGTARDLIHGTSYSVVLSYQDAVGNPVASDTHANVVIDLQTESPVIVSPTDGSRFKEAFAYSFQLPETAEAGTVKLVLFSASDSNSPHTIVFHSGFESAGTHTLTMRDLSGLAGNLTEVASKTPLGFDLIDGVTYVITAQYEDLTGNSQAQTSISATFDTQTETPTFGTPATNTPIKEAFVLAYTLPESAALGTLQLQIVDAGSYDTTLVLASTKGTAGPHSITMTSLSMAQNSLSEVLSVSGTGNMQHGITYTFTLKYQDTALNDVSQVVHTGVEFDTYTLTPLLSSPGNNSFIASSFLLQFRLYEIAAAGTVKLTCTRTGGSADINSPHVITFAGAFESAAVHTETIGLLSALAASSTNVASVSSGGGTARDLIDGAVYSFQLEYQDLAGNEAVFMRNENVG